MAIFGRNKQKVFVIGSNKTGTTSLGSALQSLGYRLGDQTEAELLVDDWSRRDFRRIVQYCHSADAFQDIPFSLDYTFQAVDAAFPGSKFILSVRDNPDQWYRSLTRFHSKRMGLNRLPTAEEMRADDYVRPGYQWHAMKLLYGVDEHTIWNEQIYKNFYLKHIEHVKDYFKFRPQDLLVINLSDGDAMAALCTYLGRRGTRTEMPRLNSSS